ncbi:hypothetical protein [Henriciella sp.]|uniref:hypothetical protein n=1 Tax=Henriciella sp. TaxID=1968823 RepID=UPI0026286B96|nr:hypothetical protein [Henriciella sp.]
MKISTYDLPQPDITDALTDTEDYPAERLVETYVDFDADTFLPLVQSFRPEVIHEDRTEAGYAEDLLWVAHKAHAYLNLDRNIPSILETRKELEAALKRTDEDIRIGMSASVSDALTQFMILDSDGSFSIPNESLDIWAYSASDVHRAVAELIPVLRDKARLAARNDLPFVKAYLRKSATAHWIVEHVALTYLDLHRGLSGETPKIKHSRIAAYLANGLAMRKRSQLAQFVIAFSKVAGLDDLNRFGRYALTPSKVENGLERLIKRQTKPTE